MSSVFVARSSIIPELNQASKNSREGEKRRIYGQSREYIMTATCYLDQHVARVVPGFEWTPVPCIAHSLVNLRQMVP